MFLRSFPFRLSSFCQWSEIGESSLRDRRISGHHKSCHSTWRRMAGLLPVHPKITLESTHLPLVIMFLILCLFATPVLYSVDTDFPYKNRIFRMEDPFRTEYRIGVCVCVLLLHTRFIVYAFFKKIIFMTLTVSNFFLFAFDTKKMYPVFVWVFREK